MGICLALRRSGGCFSSSVRCFHRTNTHYWTTNSSLLEWLSVRVVDLVACVFDLVVSGRTVTAPSQNAERATNTHFSGKIPNFYIDYKEVATR